MEVLAIVAFVTMFLFFFVKIGLAIDTYLRLMRVLDDDVDDYLRGKK